MGQSTRQRVPAPGGAFGAELEVAAEAGDALRPDAALHPRDQVEIVARLRHQHARPAVVVAVPFAAHERNGHVMIGDVLGCLYIQDVADGPLDHLLPDGRVERGITQHVADRHFAIARRAVRTSCHISSSLTANGFSRSR